MAKKVIIFDDSIFTVRQLTEFFTKEMKFEVVATARDGTQAIELYEKFKPDLITLDISMPNKDGKETLQDLLHAYPEATIMMISAVRGDRMLECISMGAAEYVEKPLKFNDPGFFKEFKETVCSVCGI